MHIVDSSVASSLINEIGRLEYEARLLSGPMQFNNAATAREMRVIVELDSILPETVEYIQRKYERSFYPTRLDNIWANGEGFVLHILY